jgi:hypothetical protein
VGVWNQLERHSKHENWHLTRIECPGSVLHPLWSQSWIFFQLIILGLRHLLQHATQKLCVLLSQSLQEIQRCAHNLPAFVPMKLGETVNGCSHLYPSGIQTTVIWCVPVPHGCLLVLYLFYYDLYNSSVDFFHAVLASWKSLHCTSFFHPEELNSSVRRKHSKLRNAGDFLLEVQWNSRNPSFFDFFFTIFPFRRPSRTIGKPLFPGGKITLKIQHCM